MLNIWCDGSITGSHWAPKGQKHTLPHLWCGWVAKTPDRQVVKHHSVDMGEWPGGSANVAEYMAVRSALRWLAGNHRAHALTVHSDSQIVMNQLAGRCQTHNATLLKWRDHVRVLAALFPHVTYKWIPREQNKEADVLSKGFQIWGRVPTWSEVDSHLEPYGSWIESKLP
jgi:ribonuclease HI